MDAPSSGLCSMGAGPARRIPAIGSTAPSGWPTTYDAARAEDSPRRDGEPSGSCGFALQSHRRRSRRAQRPKLKSAPEVKVNCGPRGSIDDMAHRRKPLAAALALNTVVLVVELAGGIQASSLSLVVDGVHNVSDEVALGFLVLAYALRAGLSGRLLRAANLFNSIGLLAISGLLLWRVLERLSNPVPVLGLVPVIAGIVGAVGNWGVARVLREPAREDAAIRLAYVHNLGDTLLSLAPVAAGILVIASGQAIFDSIVALVIAVAIVVTTVRSVVGSHRELLWADNVVCGHR